jgi:predicted component of type VI protein secretion system
MQARLKVVQDNANLKQVKLLPVTLIGRSAECHLKIASSEVSRKHCRITVTDDAVVIEDLNSSNGTYVNHERIPPARPVSVPPGTHLHIGPAKFIVDYTPPVTLETMSTTVLKSADVARLQAAEQPAGAPVVTTEPLSKFPAPAGRPVPAPAEPKDGCDGRSVETASPSEPSVPSTVPELSAERTVAMNSPAQETATAIPPLPPAAPAVESLPATTDSFDFGIRPSATEAAAAVSAVSSKSTGEKTRLFGFLSRKKHAFPANPSSPAPAPAASPQDPFEFPGPPAKEPAAPTAPPAPDDPFSFLKGM